MLVTYLSAQRHLPPNLKISLIPRTQMVEGEISFQYLYTVLTSTCVPQQLHACTCTQKEISRIKNKQYHKTHQSLAGC